MGERILLDCTLRDGGYLNDWNFGHDTIVSIFERLVSTGVEIIEIGFLDDRRSFDPDRTIMPDTFSADKIFSGLDRGNAMIVGMIDYGTCKIENIQPCEESYLDGIRVIFKEHHMYEAIAFCKQIKDLGYKVFSQMVSVTTYSDEKLAEFSKLANELCPYAVSIVDTYGLLHQNNLMHIFKELDKHLRPEISLGYHSHNNFQMAYANCIEILNSSAERNILVDGTLYGLGKSAGNAPLELLGMYMNDNLGKRYDISQMLEAIDVNIMDIYQKVQWGYNLFYYVSASTKCHPSYVSYLMDKRTLSMKSVIEILNKLEGEKKLLYDHKLIDKLYLDYQTMECNDEDSLRKLENELYGRKVLVLGPGNSMEKEIDSIIRYINENKPIVIAINYIPKKYKPDYVFLANAKRYVQVSTALSDELNKNTKLIATSNVTKTEGVFDYTLNYSFLIDEATEIPDNSLIMLLRVFIKTGVTDVALAGFDGYSETETNYFNYNMEYSFAREKAKYLNEYTKGFLKDNRHHFSLSFVTPSCYQEE